jgi:cytosine/adenosine deaminase-related metal-dependent hydrolase
VSPIEYLANHGLIRAGTSLIHMNFAADSDLDLLARTQEKEGPVSVVHCPRSHRYFKRLRFPIERFLGRGLTIAIGTDSLASNESMDMLEELRVLKSTYPELSAEEILRMGTLHGAIATGWEETAGTLEAGKAADLIAVQVRPQEPESTQTQSWAAAVLAPDSKVVYNMIQGRIVFDQEQLCDS